MLCSVEQFLTWSKWHNRGTIYLFGAQLVCHRCFNFSAIHGPMQFLLPYAKNWVMFARLGTYRETIAFIRGRDQFAGFPEGPPHTVAPEKASDLVSYFAVKWKPSVITAIFQEGLETLLCSLIRKAWCVSTKFSKMICPCCDLNTLKSQPLHPEICSLGWWWCSSVYMVIYVYRIL